MSEKEGKEKEGEREREGEKEGEGKENKKRVQKERKGRGKANEKRREEERKKRRESKRLNLVIFLISAFLVALSIHAGVLTCKQTSCKIVFKNSIVFLDR